MRLRLAVDVVGDLFEHGDPVAHVVDGRVVVALQRLGVLLERRHLAISGAFSGGCAVCGVCAGGRVNEMNQQGGKGGNGNGNGKSEWCGWGRRARSLIQSTGYISRGDDDPVLFFSLFCHCHVMSATKKEETQGRHPSVVCFLFPPYK